MSAGKRLQAQRLTATLTSITPCMTNGNVTPVHISLQKYMFFCYFDKSDPLITEH